MKISGGKNRDEDDLIDERDGSDDENAMMPAMDGSEAFHQVVKDMLMNGHQVRKGRGREANKSASCASWQ